MGIWRIERIKDETAHGWDTGKKMAGIWEAAVSLFEACPELRFLALVVNPKVPMQLLAHPPRAIIHCCAEAGKYNGTTWAFP